ncbi:MAG: SDR family NAD(P)-dependent oxidoreductase, partial [Tistlia sp.]
MKHALVTGGTRGIGYGVVEVLLEAGWSVTATGVSEQEVAGCPPHERLTARPLDVTDQAAVEALVGGLERLDGL